MTETTIRLALPIRVLACPNCGKNLQLVTVKSYWTEVRIKCPTCQTSTTICPHCGVDLTKGFYPDRKESA